MEPVSENNVKKLTNIPGDTRSRTIFDLMETGKLKDFVESIKTHTVENNTIVDPYIKSNSEIINFVIDVALSHNASIDAKSFITKMGVQDAPEMFDLITKDKSTQSDWRPSGKTQFTNDLAWRFDAHLNKKSSSSTQQPTDATASVIDFSIADIVRYNNNKYEKQDKSGKFTGYDFVGDYNRDKICPVVGMDVKNGECATMLKLLTESKNIDDIHKYIESNNFAIDSVYEKITLEEIKKTDPNILMEILNKFGFNIYENNGVKRYCSYGDWLGKLDDKIRSTFNENYKHVAIYLRNMVWFINNNPQILNKNNLNSHPPNTTQTSELKPLPRIFMGNPYNTSSALTQFFNQVRTPALFGQQQQFVFPFNSHGGQLGGGNRDSKLRVIILGLIKDLERMGKKVRDADKERILEQINLYEKYDENIKKFAADLSKYKTYVNLSGDRTHGDVPVDDLDGKFIHKYNEQLAAIRRCEHGLLNVASCLNNHLSGGATH